MQRRFKPYAPDTLEVRFWSDGKMAKSSFDRYEYFIFTNQPKEAAVILSEWIIE